MAQRSWLLLPPLLALLAYFPALRVGFLADDLILLYQRAAHAAQSPGLDWQLLLPDANPYWRFYRPTGWMLTWEVGWHVWGLNPLPYHLLGLLLHAAVSLLLALWVREATNKVGLACLAGALFAVFPLHLEATAWLAAQYDVLAAFFGLLALWLFTRWWRQVVPGAEGGSSRRATAPLYLFSLLCYLLSLLSKESWLTILPLYLVSAWLVHPTLNRRITLKLAYSIVPYGAVLAFAVGIRLLTWDNLGNYPWARSDFANYFWSGLTTYTSMLLSPVNSVELGGTTSLIVGIVSSTLLIAGLAVYGRRQWRLLLAAACWIALTLAPVLNLPVGSGVLLNNRFLYSPAIGYCLMLATLLFAMRQGGRRTALVATSLATLLVSLGVGTSWVQLGPWITASELSDRMSTQLNRLIPGLPGPPASGNLALLWYVENPPIEYRGAWLFVQGLEKHRYFAYGDQPTIKITRDAASAPITAEARDTFAMRFNYSERSPDIFLSYLSGVTSAEDTSPPASSEPGTRLSVWNFRKCAPGDVAAWQPQPAPSGTTAVCETGKGLVVRPASSGAPEALEGPSGTGPLRATGQEFVRVRVSASYAGSAGSLGTAVWSWKGEGEPWNDAQSRTFSVKGDGMPHIYWTYIRASEVRQAISRLRFSTGAISSAATIQWIAVDLVP